MAGKVSRRAPHGSRAAPSFSSPPSPSPWSSPWRSLPRVNAGISDLPSASEARLAERSIATAGSGGRSRSLLAAGGVFAAVLASIAVGASRARLGVSVQALARERQALLWSLGRQGKTQFDFDRAGKPIRNIYRERTGFFALQSRPDTGQMDGGQRLERRGKTCRRPPFRVWRPMHYRQRRPECATRCFDGCDKARRPSASAQNTPSGWSTSARRPTRKNVSQFKINIFPQVARRCDVVIGNWDIRTY